MMDQNRIEALRARRAAAAASEERKMLRSRHGAWLVEQINASSGLNLSLDRFAQRAACRVIDWPLDLRDAPGLVAAYVDRVKVEQILDCVSVRLGAQNGYLGFHDKEYLGFACVSGFSLGSMVEIASATSDSAVFYSEDWKFALLVDSYGRDSVSQFSLVLQGENLEGFATCF